ncbi:MAG TPA: flagellar biosynthesis protein FlhA [Alphaproteobacteria bacterium]|nr:flagellar biosynthesis protein FlhA [Alphaproteobacteria bacterium]
MNMTRMLAQARQLDVMLALGVLALIVLFFVPLPGPVLDLLIATNITLGVLVLLTVLFIKRALDFSSFPMMLLVTTTFRLALNVASTRLILENGHNSTNAAGHIIEAFGKVIMGGNFIIGLVIFSVLIIVNFVVITKGSGRIAEVAARFTLDSLPGKQMAIDADLNAGLINESEARQRRTDLENETGFFGAMDGASKFVRGDAIVGLIITAINVVVGVIVGVVQHKLGGYDALSRYTLLAVGDGLVAYIPALTISIAAGMLVAKSGTNEGAGTVLFGQLATNYRALFVAAGLTAFLALLPNMPIIPFFLMSGGLGFAGMQALRASRKPKPPTVDELKKAEEAVAATAAPAEPPLASYLHVDTLKLEMGYALLGLIDESRGGRLTEQIKETRRQLAKQMGVVMPSVRIQDNLQLKPGEYNIFIKDIKAGGGVLEPGQLLAIAGAGGTAAPLEGKETTDPAFGIPAKWIGDAQKDQAQFNGYTVVDNSTVVTTHLTEIIKDNLADLLTRQELDKLLDELRPNHAKLIEELIPEKYSKAALQKVLQNLLRERISIRDLPAIMEAMAEAPGLRNLTILTEHVRARLARQINAQFGDADGTLTVVAMSPAWEKEFKDSMIMDGEERQLAMAPDKVQNFLKVTRDTFERQFNAGLRPILLTSPGSRPFARLLIERALPLVPVISQAELSTRARLRTVATI